MSDIIFSRDMAVAKKRWFIVDITNLVGGFNPSEKHESQLGLFFPIYEKTCSKPTRNWLMGFINQLIILQLGGPILYGESPFFVNDNSNGIY